MFSIKFDGRVILHSNSVVLTDVKFKVSKKGQERVRREKRKNVHATLQTHNIQEKVMSEIGLKEVYYNPYTTDTFIMKDSGEPIFYAHKVLAKNNKIYVIK